MYFFVNQYLLTSNSSVEHAELKRLALFKQHQAPAKLVTRDFDPLLHQTIKKFGLSDEQLINLYDFFAETSDYAGHDLHTEDLGLASDYQVGTGNNYREVKDGDRLVCEVHFAPGTIGLVNRVDYYDQVGNLTLRQKYDLRGFKSAEEFFGEDGKGYYTRYYRPDGQVYLESYYVKSVENTPINSLNVLRDYRGRDYFFDSMDDLFTFFLDELNRTHGENNIFVADRPAVAIKPVQAMTSWSKKYLWIPMNQVNDGQDLLSGPLNEMLQGPVTSEAAKWDGLIVMTPQQKEILNRQIKGKLPIEVINGTPVITTPARVAMVQRTPGQLLYVGRLGEDKQISQLLNMFAQIHQQVPSSKLTLYGYGTSTDMDNYRQQVEQLGLTKAVDFAGYQVDLDQAYDQAQLLLDASRTDGQPLAMGEALAHGVPVVSYDYLYGPASMITAGENGELIPLNKQAEFIQAVVRLLQRPATLQQFSDGAYDSVDALAGEKTWQQWQRLSTI